MLAACRPLGPRCTSYETLAFSSSVRKPVVAIAASGLPIERYYHWCFTDNWEWTEGEGPRFGLVHLDYETQARTPRESARFYADVIAHGGVTADAYERWVAPTAYRVVRD